MGVSSVEAKASVEATVALGRILEASELVPVLLLLASEDGSGVTGQVWHVDGRWRV